MSYSICNHFLHVYFPNTHFHFQNDGICHAFWGKKSSKAARVEFWKKDKPEIHFDISTVIGLEIKSS